VTRKCFMCPKTFEAQRSDKRTCSPKCRQRLKRERDGIPTTERGAGQFELQEIRKDLARFDLMGYQGEKPGDDAGECEPQRNRGYACSQPPQGLVNNPVYGQLEEAFELYHGLVVMQSGFDQYDGERKGGWISGRGSNPNRKVWPHWKPTLTEREWWGQLGLDPDPPKGAWTERPITLRVQVVERPLKSLDVLDHQEAKQHGRELRQRAADAPTVVRPSIVHGVQPVKFAKCDGSTNEEMEVTLGEIENVVERVVQRETGRLKNDLLNAIVASSDYDPVSEAEEAIGVYDEEAT
jgi:hypothetical protein